MKTENRLQSAYSKFIEQVKAAQVQRVTLTPYRIEYSLKPEFGTQLYYTVQPFGQTEDLRSLLQRHGVEIATQSDNANAAGLVGLLLSTGLLVGTFAWLMKLSQAGTGGGVGLNVGKSNAQVYNQGLSA
jgi:cell division protease FtsH